MMNFHLPIDELEDVHEESATEDGIHGADEAIGETIDW